MVGVHVSHNINLGEAFGGHGQIVMMHTWPQ